MIKSTFSIEPGCFDIDNESEFLKAGKALFEPSFVVGLKFLSIPFLSKWAADLIPIPYVIYSILVLYDDIIDNHNIFFTVL